MKTKNTKIIVALTDEQITKLEPLMKKVSSAYKKGKPGMVLAQVVVFNDGNGLMSCGFIENEIALKIQAAMKPESVGRNTDRINWKSARDKAGI